MEWVTVLKEMNDNGYILDVCPHNQIEEGYESEVLAGNRPLITYTATIQDKDLAEHLFAESCDSFVEAVESAIGFYRKEMKKLKKISVAF